MCNKSSTTIIIQLIIRTNRHVSKTKKDDYRHQTTQSRPQILCPKGCYYSSLITVSLTMQSLMRLFERISLGRFPWNRLLRNSRIQYIWEHISEIYYPTGNRS